MVKAVSNSPNSEVREHNNRQKKACGGKLSVFSYILGGANVAKINGYFADILLLIARRQIVH